MNSKVQKLLMEFEDGIVPKLTLDERNALRWEQKRAEAYLKRLNKLIRQLGKKEK